VVATWDEPQIPHSPLLVFSLKNEGFYAADIAALIRELIEKDSQVFLILPDEEANVFPIHYEALKEFLGSTSVSVIDLRQRRMDADAVAFKSKDLTGRIVDVLTSRLVALEKGAPIASDFVSKGYSVPIADLDKKEGIHFLVDRETGVYLGHPTTVLMDDGQSIFAVYPKGHGKGPIVLKKSLDGGKTWSERLPTPISWASSLEVPTLYRTVDSRGKKRLIMFSGLYPIRMAYSEDEGETWSELKAIGDFGGIVAMGAMERMKDGSYMAFFHDDGRFFKDGGKASGFTVYSTTSTDGGMTWSDPVGIARHENAHLCEPGVIRSPDGNSLAMLLRENSRTLNSFIMFSKDEGKTWSDLRQVPGALTGDRHTAVYNQDGRLFISFRDRTHDSPTWGDWVGWVGTWNDLVNGSEGEYRVRIKDNTKGADTTYPGVLIQEDGTIVTTTYGHWDLGEQPYILTARFTLQDLDSIVNSD